MRQLRRSILRTGTAALAALVLSTPARASLLFSATLDGASERPTPVATAATGTGSVLLDDAETSIAITLSWANLGSNAILAHIHGPADANGTAAPIIDLTTVLPATPNTSGTLVGSPVNVSVTPQMVADLKAGLWYFNVHSVNFGGGEIRGQIVPEPATALLLGAGLVSLARISRRGRVS